MVGGQGVGEELQCHLGFGILGVLGTTASNTPVARGRRRRCRRGGRRVVVGHIGNPTVPADDGIRRLLGFGGLGGLGGHESPTAVLAATCTTGLTTVDFLVVDVLGN